MGRPINSRLIGPPNPDFDQASGIANLGNGAEPVIILNQRSNARYHVQSASDPEVTGTVILVNQDDLGNLNLDVGEMCIPVTPDGGTTVEFVRNLNNRTVKTFQGNVYGWPADAEILELDPSIPDD